MRGSIRCVACKARLRECDCRANRWEMRAAGRSKQVRGGKREAEAALAEWVRELSTTALDMTGRIPLSALMERWVQDVRNRGREGNTLRGYEQHAAAIAAHRIGGIRIDRLTVDDLNEFYGSLVLAERKPTTIARYHSSIRAALNFAATRGWVAANVATATARPTPRRPKLVCPTPQQVSRLLEEAVNHSEEAAMFFRLAVATWARRGEIVALRWSNIDLATGDLTIEESVSAVSGRKDTKTHAVRKIKLDAVTLDQLQTYREWQTKRAEQAVRPKSMVDDPFLFSDCFDGRRPWHPDTPTNLFETIKKRAKVEGVRLHDLRHFGPTQALQAGASIVSVSHRLGHAKVSTTLDVYAQFMPATDAGLANITAAVVASASQPALTGAS